MTIEDLPESTRCPDCGTWLPRSALECPSCGRPRDIALTAPPRRGPPSRRLLIGGGATIILLGAVVLWAIRPADVPGPSQSPSPSPSSGVALVSPSSRPTSSPTPQPTVVFTPFPRLSLPPSVEPTATPLPPAQRRAPLVLPIEIPDMGRRAKVTAAALKVRSYPGTAGDVQLVLAAGSELLLRTGPVVADGYDWYEAYYSSAGDPQYYQGIAIGWVAAGASGKAPSLIQIGAPSCPVLPVTVALLGSMTDLARTTCVGSATFQVDGMVDTCIEGPITPYVYQPAWLAFSCYAVVEVGTGVSAPIFFPPSVPLPDSLGRGDLVRLEGHLLDPAAASCSIAPQDPSAVPATIEIDRQIYMLSCRSALVLSAIEVTGHLNRPDPFGF